MTTDQHQMIPIQGVIKNYPWGSHTTLANHRGAERSAKPEAELWFGDSPHGPALVVGSVDTLDVLTREIGQLPFLAKILAVEHSLSLQVHPALSDIEFLSGVRKDENHKPEMIVALSEFHALVGFASVESILQLVTELNSPLVTQLIANPLRAGAGLSQILDELLGIADSSGVLDEVRARIDNLEPIRRKWLLELIDLYAPKLDPLATLLCELVVLSPGESLYLPPRCIHAYLHGTVVEVMANSDNVIRGGLTNKPIDKKNFLALIDTNHGLAQRITPVIDQSFRQWDAPIPDFSLREFHGEIATSMELANHAIAFAWSGSMEITREAGIGAGQMVSIRHHHGALLPPGKYRLAGQGSLWVTTGKGR